MSDEMNIGETGPNFKRGWARRFGSPSMPGRPGLLLTGQGELAHERDNLDVEQIQAAEFGGELRGGPPPRVRLLRGHVAPVHQPQQLPQRHQPRQP
jgi:hypothetical protein